jgi:D-alanyl-D-alanine carboxypeptidase
MKHLYCLTVLLLLASACSHGPLDTSADIDDLIEDNIQNEQTTGLQYIVVSPGKTLYSRAAGLEDVKSRKKLQKSSLLMTYSMTKTIIAVIALKLHQTKTINISDSVSKYFNYLPYREDIKIHHLLSQSSGIPNPIPLRWAHLKTEHDDFSEDHILKKRLKHYPNLDFTPGDRYQYSNLSYAILGKTLEIASGNSLEQLLNIHIRKPLGIGKNELSFIYNQKSNYAKGYLKKWSFMNLFKQFVVDDKFFGEYEDNWLRIQPHHVDFKAMGGLFSNAQTLALVLQDLVKDQSRLLNDTSKSLLSCAVLSNDGEDLPMTLGWHVKRKQGQYYFYKEGGGAGYHNEMRIYPESQIASVLMTNSTTFDVKKFLDRTDKLFIKAN